MSNDLRDEMNLDLPAEMFRSGETVEEATIRMQHRSSGSDEPVLINVDIEYSEVDGLAMFEGDIVLGTFDEVFNAFDSFGIGIRGDQFRWPGGLIPYVTQATVRERAEAAMAHWEARTPIRFKPRESEANYVSFEAHEGCWSNVGMQGGKQVISLDDGCSVGSAIHEIGHTLGLWHEQSRSDRDEHIEILLENVRLKARHNFDKHIQDGIDLGDYDFDSIMHYPATAFGIGGKVTIRTKDGQAIGQRNGLSDGDVAAIRLLYPDLDWPDDQTAG